MKSRLRTALVSTVSIGLFFSLSACSNPGPVAGPPGSASLKLEGNPVGTMLVIDDALTFRLTENSRTEFKLQPGRHHIRIERNGAAILDQTNSVTAGQTLELTVP